MCVLEEAPVDISSRFGSGVERMPVDQLDVVMWSRREVDDVGG